MELLETATGYCPRTWYNDTPPASTTGFRGVETIPYAATPLYPHNELQRRIEEDVHQLYVTPHPEDIPATFVDLVELDYERNRTQRNEKNYKHFVNYYTNTTDAPELAHDVLQASLLGEASPAMLLNFLVRSKDLKAIELAKISMPYGYRLDEYTAMRHDVQQSIEAYPDGFYAPDESFSHIHEQLNFEHTTQGFNQNAKSLPGVLMTYRRHLGAVSSDSSTVIVEERQSLAVRLDEAGGLNDYLNQRARDEYGDKFEYQTIDYVEKLQTQLQSRDPAQLDAAHMRLSTLVQEQPELPFLVPLSAVVFAYRHEPERTKTENQEIVTRCIAQLALRSSAVIRPRLAEL